MITDGPWGFHKPDGYFGYLITAHDESVVAREVHPKANARLIASIPDLLEALENSITVCSNIIEFGLLSYDENEHELALFIGHLQDEVAKAKGTE